jgi:hypothetical protein
VNDYHLILDLNGVLVVMGEGQTKICLIVLRPNLKEFLSTCVKFFMVYIWFNFGNEEKLLEAVGNYCQENWCSPSIF